MLCSGHKARMAQTTAVDFQRRFGEFQRLSAPDCFAQSAPRNTDNQLGGEHLAQIGPRRRQVGKNLHERAVVEAEVAFEDGGEDRAVVGGYREVPGLIELRCREAGPIAVDATAADTAARDPDDIAVAVIGPAIAVLANPAT